MVTALAIVMVIAKNGQQKKIRYDGGCAPLPVEFLRLPYFIGALWCRRSPHALILIVFSSGGGLVHCWGERRW